MFPTIYDQFKKLKKSDVKINKKMIFLTIHAEYGGSYRYRKKRNPRWLCISFLQCRSAR